MKSNNVANKPFSRISFQDLIILSFLLMTCSSAFSETDKNSAREVSNLVESNSIFWQLLKKISNNFEKSQNKTILSNSLQTNSINTKENEFSYGNSFDKTQSSAKFNKIHNKLREKSINALEITSILPDTKTTPLESEVSGYQYLLKDASSEESVPKRPFSYEDAFSLSSLLHGEPSDKILLTDSSSFIGSQNKRIRQSFRSIYDVLHRGNKTNKSNHLKKKQDINFVHTNENTKSFRPKQFKNSSHSSSGEAILPIYEEISGALHIDTSIDDIEDEFPNSKATENNDRYLPPINTSHINFVAPEMKVNAIINNETVSAEIVKNTTTVSPTVHTDFRSTLPTTTSTVTDVSSSSGELSVNPTYKSHSNEGLDLQLSGESSIFATRNKISSLQDDLRHQNKNDESRNLSSVSKLKNPNAHSTNSSSVEKSNASNNATPISLVKHVGAFRLHKSGVSERGPVLSKNVSKKQDGLNGNTSEKFYYSLFGYNENRKERKMGQPFKEKLTVEIHNKMVLEAQAQRMLLVMNQTADPCSDFYEYACGLWPDVYPLEDKALDNTFDRLREGLDEVLKSLLEEPLSQQDSKATQAAKTLYRGCLDMESIGKLGTNPLLDLLKELGGWPVLEGDNWKEQLFDWVEVMGKLRTYNNDVLLAEWVAADITNSSNHIIQIDQPELGLPSREYFLSPGDEQYRKGYLDLMLRSCQILGAEPIIALTDMLEVINFEKELAKILIPTEERRNLSAVHRRFTHEELQKEIPQINWKKYLSIVSGKSADYTNEVIVFCLEYIKNLVSLIETTSRRTLSNYLLWRFVKNRISNLGDEALEAKQEFIQTLFGSKSQPERWLSCVSYVNGNLGYVVGALFVKKYYPASSKNDSEEMIRLIRESFTMAINDASWMHERTRQIAADKVESMKRNVGYPDYILDDEYMDSVYGELEFNTTTHFWNVLQMLKFHVTKTHDLLEKPVNRSDWNTTPAVVNAYYSRSKNMIMFPAGILQPPFYHPAFPRCLNFGGVGVVIGHEISHGFDDRGRQFDRNGNLHQWWTKEDVSRFYDRATCMLVQYGEYEVDSVGMSINSVNTLSENIADNAGLKIAYKAYQKWKSSHSDQEIKLPGISLNNNQLFFLNFGQIWCEVNSPEAMLTKLRGGQHSPNKYRVIGTLSNSEEFSKAFNCPLGSPMNPKEKCKVW